MTTDWMIIIFGLCLLGWSYSRSALSGFRFNWHTSMPHLRRKRLGARVIFVQHGIWFLLPELGYNVMPSIPLAERSRRTRITDQQNRSETEQALSLELRKRRWR